MLSAYLVYIYPIQRLTDWLGRPDLLKLPSTVGLWMLMIAVLWLSDRKRGLYHGDRIDDTVYPRLPVQQINPIG